MEASGTRWNVDHDGVGFHHVGSDEVGAADGDHEYVGLASELGEVLRFAVADGYGAVEPFAREQVGGRGAHYVGAADDHAVFAGGLDVVALEEGADSHGGGGDEALFAEDHASDVDRCEAVHVLVGRDGVNDLLLVDVLGQRELDDEAVDVWVVVEEVDGFEELLFGGLLAHAVYARGEAYLVAGLFFVGHVCHAGAVLAYDYSCQMGGAVSLRGECAHLVGNLVFYLQSQCFAVQ